MAVISAFIDHLTHINHMWEQKLLYRTDGSG